jgi:nicotinamide mononucleotide adenylyltransferase
MKNNQLLIVYGLLPKILDKVIYLRKQTDDAAILNHKVKKCLKQTSKRRISTLKTFKSKINSEHALLKTSMKHSDKKFKNKKTIKRVKKLKGTRRKKPKHV